MRALTISGHGGIERLEVRDDLPVPPIVRPGDVRVRIGAAALNHLDLYLLGGLPGVTITPPFVVGTDGAGTIDAVGDEVAGLAPGDAVVVNPGISCRACEFCEAGEHSLCTTFRVLGEHLPGLAAEYVVVPAANVRAIPAGVPVEVAAAFPLATLTAWRMLLTRARVRPGDEVLIWGIGGGVALAALQICRQVGARTWVTSSSDEKLERARAMGADETINHAREDVGRVVRDRTGKRGVDVVVDSVGEATWQRSLHALARGGRLVTCGGTSGPMLQTDVRRLFWYQWDLMGSTMGNDAEFDAVCAQLAAGRLHPPIDRVFPLADARAAYERLREGRQFGKIVLDLRPDGPGR